VSFNSISLGIEQIGFATQHSWPNAQLQKTAQQVASWSTKFDIPLTFSTSHGVCQHKDLGSAGGGHSDCGPDYPFDRVLAMAKEFVSGKPSGGIGGGSAGSSTGVVKVGWTVYTGTGGAGGLRGGEYDFAELGTATRGGVGTGVGNLAKALGMSGELDMGAQVRVRSPVNGVEITIVKRDRGYGQGGNGTTSDQAYSIDFWDGVASGVPGGRNPLAALGLGGKGTGLEVLSVNGNAVSGGSSGGAAGGTVSNKPKPMTQAMKDNQLAASVLFGNLVVNVKNRQIRDPNYSKKEAQLLSDRLARAAKSLSVLADGNVLVRQGDRAHVLGYPLDLFIRDITQTISRTDHNMQLTLAWREYEVSDMEDWRQIQQAGAQYASAQAQIAALNKLANQGSGGGGGGGGNVPATPSGGYTPETWAPAMLRAGGFPTTNPNVNSVVHWEKLEGGHWANQAKYNPLNTKQPEPGSSTPAGFASPGIRAYASWASGIKGTIDTLNNGNYPDVLAALKAGRGLGGHLQGLFTWSGSYYSA
jgi:hypothetical protein